MKALHILPYMYVSRNISLVISIRPSFIELSTPVSDGAKCKQTNVNTKCVIIPVLT